jgi:hypothetical protein
MVLSEQQNCVWVPAESPDVPGSGRCVKTRTSRETLCCLGPSPCMQGLGQTLRERARSPVTRTPLPWLSLFQQHLSRLFA